MSEELTLQQKTELSRPMSEKDVLEQVKIIQRIMKAVMLDGQHYGTIPGCGDKPALLKAGAEKLALTFRLAPKFTIQSTDLPDGHREYRILTELYHILTGNFVGAGVGCATTMEGKYRYRAESTGKPVPKEYWTNRDPSLIGGTDFSPRKQAGNWVIYHRVEHDNPADYYNTVLKISKKRSLVDAILTATAASDIFTQDIEETTIPEQDTAQKQSQQAQNGNKPEHTVEYPITEAQVKKIHVTFGKEYNIQSEDLRHQIASTLLKREDLIESFKDLTKNDGMKLIDMLVKQQADVKAIIQAMTVSNADVDPFPEDEAQDQFPF